MFQVFKFNNLFFRFAEPVFLPLKRLNPERVTGLVENLSESLLSRKFGADTVSTLVRTISLMGFLWFLLKSVKKWRKAPFSQGRFAGLLFSEYLCIVRRENEDFDEGCD